MDPEIPASDYRTHIIILHKLLRIEARLEQLESLVGREDT